MVNLRQGQFPYLIFDINYKTEAIALMPENENQNK
jgi:hypothetical protein